MSDSLQQIDFNSSINSIVFDDNFKKLDKKEQLKFIRKLIDLAGYITVSNQPENWYEHHIVAYDYVYNGNLEKQLYDRWTAIWKIIITQTYAVIEIKEDNNIAIFSKSYFLNEKNNKKILENAIIFEEYDETGEYGGVYEKSYHTARHYFQHKKFLKIRPHNIRLYEYKYSHLSGLLQLISTNEPCYCYDHSLQSILKNNDETKYLEICGFNITDVPNLNEKIDN